MPGTTMNEPESAMELGVSFDGRCYHYREYRYDRLADALAYARLDRARSPDRRDSPAPLRWAAPILPTEAESALMAEFGITFDGAVFHLGPYRYDSLADACDYARLRRGH